jgi:MFS family permease
MLNNSARFWFPFSLISLLVIAFMSNDLFLPSMPELADYFSASANLIQNAITLWFLGSMLLQLILGPLSDYYGQKYILLFSALLLCLASIACAIAPAVKFFLLARFLQGVAVSGLMVTVFAAIHTAYDAEGKATTMLGIVGMCSALAPITGPIIGAYIATFLSWQANFYLTALACIVPMLLLTKLMPVNSVADKHANPLSWQLIKDEYKNLLTNKIFLASISSYSCLFLAGGAFLAAAPFIYLEIFQVPTHYIGYCMAPMFISYMLAAGAAGKLEHYYPAKKIILTAFMVTIVLMLAFVFYTIVYKPVFAAFIIAVTVNYIALGLIGPPLNHISLSQADEKNKGSASALLTTTMMLGSTLGAFMASLFYSQTIIGIALVITLPILAAAGIYWIYIFRQVKTELTIS